ncbi:mucosal addressin cell adhesion molecule 1 [Rhinoderma darwinii]|uniref:mucosal addressin cell adhesion molecule 1 n=1 Tax=Rhinoderma darwinii TaxID=43563 RepID=UPI003F66A0F5
MWVLVTLEKGSWDPFSQNTNCDILCLACSQHYVTVYPVDPVVSVGTSIQLNCSINCPSGTVVWKGLDTKVNGQAISPGYSVQTLENISISMEGTRFCVGTCPGSRKSYEKSMELHVYALPKTLLLSNSMENGVHYLNASMVNVYPPPDISCYTGSEMLDKANDINEVHDRDYLYNVTWNWVIPKEDWPSESSYRCEAQVLVNDQVLRREATLKIVNKYETTTAVPASSTSQTTSTLSQKLKTPYVTSDISSTRPTTVKDPTRPINTDETTIDETTTAVPVSSRIQITSTLSQKLKTPYVTTNISSTRPTTMKDPNQPINTDGLNRMWILAPAAGLVGSFLLSLQICRQLSKKGFFQPNQMEFTTGKKDSKSQCSLQAVVCYDIPTKEFSV